MKKIFTFKKTLLTLAVAATAAGSANAWTAEKIYNFCRPDAGGYGHGCELIGSYANQNSLAINSHPVEVGLGKMSNGTEVLVIKNFLGCYTVYLTVNGNSAKIYDPTRQTYQLTDGATPTPTGAKYVNFERVVRQYFNTYKYGYKNVFDTKYNGAWSYAPVSDCNSSYVQDYLIYNPSSLSTDITADIYEDTYGNIEISFGPYKSYTDSSSFKADYLDSRGFSIGFDIFDNYIIRIYKSDNTMTDSKNGTYNVGIVTNNELLKSQGYDFGIYNFFNKGLTFANYNCNNSLTSSTNAPGFVYDVVKGYFSGDEVVIPCQNFYANVSGQMKSGWYDESVLRNVNYYTVGFDPATQDLTADGSIRGRYTSEGLSHDAGNNAWHHKVTGGTRHTYENTIKVTLDPWGSINESETQHTSYVNAVTGTTFELPERDITHDAKITVSKVAAHVTDEQNIMARFAGKIHTRENTKYVECYDIYVVHGNRTHANPSTSYNHDDEKGFSDAFLVVSGLKPNSGSASGANSIIAYDDQDEIPFDELKTYHGDLGNYSSGGKPSYTLFLKTNYTPESGLTPTFHALTSTLNAVVTGIDDIIDESVNAKAYAVEGGIEVADFDGEVNVYNTAGTCVYSGAAGTIQLGGGIYIVKAGSKTFKLNVK